LAVIGTARVLNDAMNGGRPHLLDYVTFRIALDKFCHLSPSQRYLGDTRFRSERGHHRGQTAGKVRGGGNPFKMTLSLCAYCNRPRQTMKPVLQDDNDRIA